MDEQQAPDLGPCCACMAVGPSVRNVLMLAQKAPIAGRGWGCLLAGCSLPSDGAVAVVCDGCLESEADLVYACRGWPGEDGRIPIGDLVGEQVHEEAAHRADETETREGVDCLEDDPAECQAMSGGTSHRPCAHCGADVGCVPVLLFRDAPSGDPEEMGMIAVCDDCFPKHYLVGMVTGRR